MDSTETPSRFVILRHEIGVEFERTDKTHFDWMFEVRGKLRTWSTVPISVSEGTEVDAEQLADHRIDYLDFEGEISGNRGVVTRVAEGHYELVDETEDLFIATLSLRDLSSEEDLTVKTTFYRNLPSEDFLDEDKLAVWCLRFERGR
jgi:hypothetical protein